MELLLASVVALVLGPVAVRVCEGRAGPWQGLDAFIFVSIAGLVGLSLLPAVLHDGGVLAALVLVAGFVVPGWLEHRFAERAGDAHNLALLLGLLGLVLHSLVDGVALAAPDVHHIEHGQELAAAVVIHRLPVGVTVWWLLRAQPVRAWLALLTVAAGTLVGYAWGQSALGGMSPFSLALFQALLAGSLMHVVVHRSHPVHQHERAPWSQFLGAILAAFVVGLSLDHHDAHGMGSIFLQLAALSAPVLLLFYASVGLALKRAGLLPLLDKTLPWVFLVLVLTAMAISLGAFDSFPVLARLQRHLEPGPIGVLAGLSLPLLALLGLGSLWRQGLRGFAGKVLLQSAEGGAHDHGETQGGCRSHD
jgi:zinc transporter ZupT